MEIGMGDLTFVTDGTDYACIWSPSGHSHDSKLARPLALIATALIKDETDFEKWRNEVTARWQVACAGLFGTEPEEILVEDIHRSTTN